MICVVRRFTRHPRSALELKVRYEQAVAFSDLAAAKIQGDGLPEPEGLKAYRDARVAERAALEAFTKAVLDVDKVMGPCPEGARRLVP